MSIAPDDPRHGSKRGHVLGCREECCRRANARYQNLWRMGRTNKTINGSGTRRRVQALQVLGWSSADIAAAGGWASKSTVRVLLRSNRSNAEVWATTAARAYKAYVALSMQPGPRVAVRNHALAKGWLPPLAWDDETIDDPAAKPYRPNTDTPTRDRQLVDEVLVQRALAGQRVKANRAERRLITERWRASGRPLADLDRVQGWNLHRDLRNAS